MRIDSQIFSSLTEYHFFQQFSDYVYYKETNSNDLPLLHISFKDFPFFLPYTIHLENSISSPPQQIKIEEDRIELDNKKIERKTLIQFDSKLYFRPQLFHLNKKRFNIFQKQLIPFRQFREFYSLDEIQLFLDLKDRGGGLTPAGSDFILGYLLIKKLFTDSDNFNLDFSNIFTQNLAYLFKNFFLPEFIHGVINYLFAEGKVLENLGWVFIRQAKNFGQTSGLAILEGITYGIKKYLNFRGKF